MEAHPITDGELRAMRERWGEAEEGQNYNTIIDGHGTGFRPPTAEEWEQLGSGLLVVDSIQTTSIQTTNDKLGAPTAVDWTTSEYFPPIRSQGMEGSCTTWAFAYYTKTFQEAREHGWDVSAGPSDMIFSPDFVYHQINGGTDGGSAGSVAVSLMEQVGAATLAEMPYSDTDHTSWPDESAWREAAMYRASGGILSIDVSSDLSTLKDLLASGNLAQLSIDASDMYEMATLENFHNLDINHANTIVGYDENWEYVEMGEVRHGAFKIANSWGNTWAGEADNDGCWWISYEALKQRVGSVTYFEDRIAYNPTTVAVFEIDHPVRGDTTVVVGVGQQYSPTDTRTFPSPAWSCDGDDPYPTGAIVFDITDLNDDVESGNNFFISVYDTGSASTGTLQHFSVEHYLDYVNGTLDVTRTSPDPLVNTVEDDTVYAELFLDSGTPAVIAHRPSRTTVSPTSSLSFDFDATMYDYSFDVSTDVVSFTGPAGDLSSQVWTHDWMDRNTLVVRFGEQSAEGQYEMVIGPGIQDTGGKWMDQNQNGVHGEVPGDTYSATFTIDFATPTLSVDLQSASDTGVSDTDNITMATQPWYDITVNTGGTLEIDWDGDDTVDQSHSVSAAGTNAYQPSAPLSEGYYPVAVKFTDTSGDVVTSTRGTTIDTGAPGAPAPPDLEAASDSGISDSDDVTGVLSPTFSVSSTDEYLRLYRDAVLASGSYESGGAVTAQMEPEGTWTYVVRAVDTAGNISAASSGLEVTIDRTTPADPVAPDLQPGSDGGVSDADDLTNVLSPTFNVASADPYFRFYRGGIQISSDYEAGAIFTAAGETEGIWDYTVAAVDAAGNESPDSAVLTVEIDTTAPAAPNVPDLQAGSDTGISDTDDITNDDTPTLDLTGFGGYWYRLERDAVQISDDYELDAPYTDAVPSDGVYTYTLFSVDLAGNESAASAGLTVQIDPTGPVVPAAPDLQSGSDSGVSDADNLTNVLSPTFNVASTDPYFRFYRDGSMISGSYETGTTYTVASEAVGTWTYSVTGVDAAGNESAASAGLTVQIDRTAPAVPAVPDLQAGSDSGISSTDNLTNVAAPVFDVVSTGAYFRFYRDSTLLSADYEPGSSTYTASGQSEGVWEYSIAAVDAAGNASAASAPLTVEIDLTAPGTPNVPDLQAGSDTGVSSDDNITSDTSPTYALSGFGNRYRLNRNGTQISADYATDPLYTDGIPSDGLYAYELFAVDLAGNVSEGSGALEVTIDTSVPTAPAAPDLQAASDSGLSSADDLTNADPMVFDIVATGQYFRFYRDAVQISGGYESGDTYAATSEPEGTWSYTLRAIDAAGNESDDSPVLEVTVDTTAVAAPPAPDLQAGSDTGVPDNNVTADRTPTFDVSVPADLYFRLYRNGAVISEAPLLGDDGGMYREGNSEQLSEQPLGAFDYTATVLDAAGNESDHSASLEVQITEGQAIRWHRYEDDVVVAIYDIDLDDGTSDPTVAWYPREFRRGQTDVFVNPGYLGDRVIGAVVLFGDGTETADLGIAVENNAGVASLVDARTVEQSLGFFISEGYVRAISLKGGIQGANLNGFTSEGGWMLPVDIDLDGDGEDGTDGDTDEIHAREGVFFARDRTWAGWIPPYHWFDNVRAWVGQVS